MYASTATARETGSWSGRSVEADLLDHLKRLERNSYDWQAAHVQLSNLRPRNRRDYQVRIAASQFESLLARRAAELFHLRNADLVLFWQGQSRSEVESIVLRLRYLFSDDPLLASGAGEEPGGPGGEAPEPAQFCAWYDLERDFDAFQTRMQQLVSDLERRRFASGEAQESRPLTPVALAQLEAKLAEAELSDLVRQQPVCVLLPGVPPQVVFNEVHFAIGDLGRAFLPGVEPAADPWLFQHLKATLDQHLLPIVSAIAQQEAISVNLRLSTLLSEDFLRFDEAFRQRHGSLLIELQLVDIYAELGAFVFIRDFVRERGHRICLDGLHHLHLPLINRKQLGVDLVKLVWSPDIPDESGARSEKLQAAIMQAGRDRVILCRCDSAEAIAWGQALGIRLFQGHYVDSKLRAARSPAVAAARQALRTTPH